MNGMFSEVQYMIDVHRISEREAWCGGRPLYGRAVLFISGI